VAFACLGRARHGRNLRSPPIAVEHALDLDRNFAESHGSLATVAALRGDQATAKREIDIANRLDPGCLSAKLAASLLKRAANDPDGARELIATTVAGLTRDDKSPLAALLAGLVRH
jgi:hypothetical protein